MEKREREATPRGKEMASAVPRDAGTPETRERERANESKKEKRSKEGG